MWAKPLPPISQCELYWLAGILEGEGSFCSGPPSDPNTSIIGMHTTDEDVAKRVCTLFGRVVSRSHTKEKAHYKDVFVARVTGGNARILMRTLKPLMSQRRQSQIDKALAAHNPVAKLKAIELRKKLPESALNEIRMAHKSGESLRKIGKRYNVDHETVRQFIMRGVPLGLNIASDDRLISVL